MLATAYDCLPLDSELDALLSSEDLSLHRDSTDFNAFLVAYTGRQYEKRLPIDQLG